MQPGDLPRDDECAAELGRLLAGANAQPAATLATRGEAEIQAFLREHGVRVLEPLARASRDRDPLTRIKAVTYLGQLRLPGCVVPLGESLADPDQRVRRMAVISLGECGEMAGIEALVYALDDEDAQVRGLAADAFARITNHAPGVDVFSRPPARSTARELLGAWLARERGQTRDAVWVAGFRAAGYELSGLPVSPEDARRPELRASLAALLAALADRRPWLRRNAELTLAQATGATRTLDDELRAAASTDELDYAVVRARAVAALQTFYRARLRLDT